MQAIVDFMSGCNLCRKVLEAGGGSVGERFEKVRGGVLYMIRKTRRRGECAGLRSQNVFPW